MKLDVIKKFLIKILYKIVVKVSNLENDTRPL